MRNIPDTRRHVNEQCYIPAASIWLTGSLVAGMMIHIKHTLMEKRMQKYRAIIYIVVIAGITFGSAITANDIFTTYYEASGYLETPHYARTVSFCKQLDSASQYVKYIEFGITPQGRKLPLLILDKSGSFERPVDGRLVLYITACIHPGESDGKDAGLMLIRDFVRDDKFSRLLDSIVVLFIPIFNVDGHERFGPYNRINQNGPAEMGFRTTAQGYNLNRDFLKADTPEMRAWLRVFNEWLPDFIVDCHVTDGADYQYVITYGIETHENMAEPVRSWITDRFLPTIDKRMELNGFPIVPYVITRDYEHITHGLLGLIWSPRYSTGYGAVQNRPALLVETHMLKDYRTRVTGTYTILAELLELLTEQKNVLSAAVAAADSAVAVSLPGSHYILNYKRTTDTTDIIEFKGYDVTTQPSDISGSEWVIWGTEPTVYNVPYLNTFRHADSALIPWAYIVPPEWTDEIGLLEAHGVEIKYLAETQMIEIGSYRFHDIEWAKEPWEGRHRLNFSMEESRETREFPVGSAVVITNQRTNQIVAHLLEPKAPDSFIRWGFFNTIYSQKEYFESYVMERIAREMLDESPELRIEFDSLLAADTVFASSPRQRLTFFYERSPYWDQTVKLYPVGRIMQPCRIALSSEHPF